MTSLLAPPVQADSIHTGIISFEQKPTNKRAVRLNLFNALYPKTADSSPTVESLADLEKKEAKEAYMSYSALMEKLGRKTVREDDFLANKGDIIKKWFHLVAHKIVKANCVNQRYLKLRDNLGAAPQLIMGINENCDVFVSRIGWCNPLDYIDSI